MQLSFTTSCCFRFCSCLARFLTVHYQILRHVGQPAWYMLLLDEGRRASWETQETQVKAEGGSKGILLVELGIQH